MSAFPRHAAAFALVCAASGVHATEWFVSTSGSDSSGTGSLTQPFRSVSHVVDPANDIVQAGDTVTLRGPAGNNVYNETEVRLRLPLTLRSQGDAAAPSGTVTASAAPSCCRCRASTRCGCARAGATTHGPHASTQAISPALRWPTNWGTCWDCGTRLPA